jgi:hypothetical protein
MADVPGFSRPARRYSHDRNVKFGTQKTPVVGNARQRATYRATWATAR